jgi:hypothetical protein
MTTHQTHITIDARGAGEGKTTSGIYPKIKQLVENKQLVLLVVPSTRLQDQYEADLQKTLPRSTKFIKINSNKQADDSRTEVSKELIKQLLQCDMGSVICITHEAWLRMSIDANIKQHWHLIIDEVINPFRVIKYKAKNSSIDWSSLINLPANTNLDDDVPFLLVEANYEQSDNFTSQINEVHSLQHKSWSTYTRANQYKRLKDKTVESAEFPQMLKIETVLDWKSLHIAAAAFSKTFMAYWFDYHEVKYEYTHQFNKRTLPIEVRVAEAMNWSMYKQKDKRFDEVMDKYHAYVENYCKENKIEGILRLRNSINKKSLSNEKILTHNVHGMNGLTNYKAVSLESALNPSKEFALFLYQEIEMNEDEINSAFSTYLFYQVLMRTSLRMQDCADTVTVFVLDNNAFKNFMDYFLWNVCRDKDNDTKLFIDVGYKEIKGRKKPALTSTERSKLYRARQKENANV